MLTHRLAVVKYAIENVFRMVERDLRNEMWDVGGHGASFDPLDELRASKLRTSRA